MCCQPRTNTKYGCVCDSQFIITDKLSVSEFLLTTNHNAENDSSGIGSVLKQRAHIGNRLGKLSMCYYWLEIVCLVSLYRDLCPTTCVGLFLYMYITNGHRLGIRWKWFICYCRWQIGWLFWLYKSWGHRLRILGKWFMSYFWCKIVLPFIGNQSLGVWIGNTWSISYC